MSVNHVNWRRTSSLPTTRQNGRSASRLAKSSTEAARLRVGPMPLSAEIDETTQRRCRRGFPWLSRLARELEPASKQPSPYGTVPLLGESCLNLAQRSHDRAVRRRSL